MSAQERTSDVFKGPPVGFPAAPVAVAGGGRLLGLDAGDWSMIVLGLALSGLLLALV